MIRSNIKPIHFLHFVVAAFLLASCNPSKQYEKEEKNQINDYLAKNSTQNFVLLPSGLYYLEVLKGTGISPVAGDSVFVRYTMMFLDGTVFYSTATGEFYDSIIGENIPGFDEGLTLMAVGGKSTILIPSKLGYGVLGKYPIQGYTPLLYDLELVRVKPAAK
jgi:FKBP-type peptidyl-prolyl cis-trans isomerase FkpA